ncbi:MAG TPA: thioesterase family protein [Balneolaceae bacterium]|nr:thioesterase family protein [Balneolaceae bacterium]
MNTYQKTYEVIWADMDPNRHMRHSVYNDYAAQTRVSLFQDYGLPLAKVAEWRLGPILFREETTFLREINLSDKITVTCAVAAMRKDGTRWTFIHKIIKEDDVEAAKITVDGAWLNLDTRKLGAPPEEMLKVIYRFPRTDDFQWIDSQQ